VANGEDGVPDIPQPIKHFDSSETDRKLLVPNGLRNWFELQKPQSSLGFLYSMNYRDAAGVRKRGIIGHFRGLGT
jgi:hypothetical protein